MSKFKSDDDKIKEMQRIQKTLHFIYFSEQGPCYTFVMDCPNLFLTKRLTQFVTYKPEYQVMINILNRLFLFISL